MRQFWLIGLVCVAMRAQAQQLIAPQSNDAVQNPRAFFVPDPDSSAGIDGAQLSPDGARVALYGHDAGDPSKPPQPMKGIVQIWDVETRQMIFDLSGHGDWVQRVVWSRDGQWLASQSQDGRILFCGMPRPENYRTN